MSLDEWAAQDHEQQARQIRARQKTLKRQYDKLIRSMQNEQIRQSQAARQKKLELGGEKEIQSFMGKLAPMPSLWGVLPRTESHRYPWVLDMSQAAMGNFQTWMGANFTTALHNRAAQFAGQTFNMRKDHITVHVFKHTADRWEVGLQPLSAIANFLQQIPALELGAINLRTTPTSAVFTSASDKLSQIEYYYAMESTACSRKCRGCGETALHPLSCVDPITGKRTIRWWCTRDQRFCELSMAEPTMAEWIRPLIVSRRFTDTPLLAEKGGMGRLGVGTLAPPTT